MRSVEMWAEMWVRNSVTNVHSLIPLLVQLNSKFKLTFLIRFLWFTTSTTVLKMGCITYEVATHAFFSSRSSWGIPQLNDTHTASVSIGALSTAGSFLMWRRASSTLSCFPTLFLRLSPDTLLRNWKLISLTSICSLILSVTIRSSWP